MATYGISAYLYKRRYYRRVVHHDAYLRFYGYEYLSTIPRNAVDLQAWIESIIAMIEQQVAWRTEHSVPDKIYEGDKRLEFDQYQFVYRMVVDHDYEHPLKFEDIVATLDEDLPGFYAFHTYVVDLDNRVFTVGELGHFLLDSLPPNSFFLQNNTTDTVDHPITLIKHIANFSRWPAPDFDVAQVHNRYATLDVQTLKFSMWGVPDWTTMTVVQQLAAELTQTVLLDNTVVMSSPDVRRYKMNFQNCCWWTLNAAAPGNLWCPFSTPQEDEQSAVAWRIHRDGQDLSEYRNWAHPHYVNPDKYRPGDELRKGRRHYWFRGCLIALCERLDAPEHVQRETLDLADRLRTGGHTTGLALAFSGRHVLAVAIDDDVVRCSSPIEFHDAKLKLLDGFLLVTHLLSPLSSIDRLPWRRNRGSERTVSLPRFPPEVVQQIVCSLDDSSYQQLPYVSWLLRQMHSDYPRVLNYQVLNRTGKSEYLVRSIGSGSTSTLYLQRKLPYVECEDSLTGSFQYVNRGPHNLEAHPEKPDVGIVRGVESQREVRLEVKTSTYRDGAWPTIRVQVVHGVWRFVDAQDANSNFRKPSLPDGLSVVQVEYELDSEEYLYARL